MLSCNNHQFRHLPARNEQDILAPDGTRFKTDPCPTTSIATSHAAGDSGTFPTQRIVGNNATGDFAVFEFDGEKYGPFEGVGVISDWTLELPSEVRHFDYNTISDVVLRIQYTASDPKSETAKAAGIAAVKKYINGQASGTVLPTAFFDIPSDFATEWAQLGKQATPDRKTATLKLHDLTSRLPFWTRGKSVTAVKSNFFVGGSSGSAVKISRKVNNETKELQLVPSSEKEWSSVKKYEDATASPGAKTEYSMMDEWCFDIGCDANGLLPFKEFYMVVQYKIA
jgi:hypothetical protein